MIQSSSSRLNESLLQVLNVRHNVTAENIANADTPNYKKKTVEFQEELRRIIENGSSDNLEVKRTHPKHIPTGETGLSGIPYRIVQNSDTTMNNNGNNVDMDIEMANLAENQLMYNYMVDKVSGHYSKIKNLLQDLK
ncbi:flagellar basal body rod protein FlgB [Paenibacillus tepidiphilus]|uniref:flagellar basal body rod protein FlgB n=1 Tax=Paenibacillus tepidiphilus TaxID=2608683 RepID=UPI00123B7E24|nr:flagellar basal body rod protein FlgB [Paenibacillus tepidiphilus]